MREFIRIFKIIILVNIKLYSNFSLINAEAALRILLLLQKIIVQSIYFLSLQVHSPKKACY